MPGSWRRSRVTQIDSSLRCEPSRARVLRRVFCCPDATEGLIENELPGESRNGRPGSRGSRDNARAQVRGACRRERGDEPDTDDRANSREFAHRGASCAAEEFWFAGCARSCASAQPTLVVKMSDTSLNG